MARVKRPATAYLGAHLPALADIAGIRALVVHAKDEDARRWYEQFDFDPSPSDPLHLFLVIKDLKRLIAASAPASAQPPVKAPKLMKGACG